MLLAVSTEHLPVRCRPVSVFWDVVGISLRLTCSYFHIVRVPKDDTRRRCLHQVTHLYNPKRPSGTNVAKLEELVLEVTEFRDVDLPLAGRTSATRLAQPLVQLPTATPVQPRVCRHGQRNPVIERSNASTLRPEVSMIISLSRPHFTCVSSAAVPSSC
jgi:hypothetical protein